MFKNGVKKIPLVQIIEQQYLQFSYFLEIEDIEYLGIAQTMKYQASLSEFSGMSSRSLLFESSLRSTTYAFDKDYKHFQYVNPQLVLQWEGTCESKYISGQGTFRAYQQSHQGVNRTKRLIFSLEAEDWKQNKPQGQIKMTHYLFYTPLQSDGVVREVRQFTGRCEDMKRTGQGQYIIEKHYSNQNKDVYEIKGTWENDRILSGKISKNGGPETSINFLQNIQLDIIDKCLKSVKKIAEEKTSELPAIIPKEQTSFKTSGFSQQSNECEFEEQVVRKDQKMHDNFLSVPKNNIARKSKK